VLALKKDGLKLIRICSLFIRDYTRPRARDYYLSGPSSCSPCEAPAKRGRIDWFIIGLSLTKSGDERVSPVAGTGRTRPER